MGVELTTSDRDGLAQLLYEVKLVSDSEPTNNKLCAIYASHNVAHIFQIETCTLPYSIKKYQKIVLEQSSDIISFLKTLID